MSEASDSIETPDAFGTLVERATLLISAASASVAFMLGFRLGAFGEVFFEQIFTIWVMSTIVFVGSIVSRLPPNRWPERLVLLIPSVWILVAWFNNPLNHSRTDDVLVVLTLIVTFVAVPFAAWNLVAAIRPDFRILPRSNKITVAAAVVAFFVVGFLFGARNDVLLTCDDFKVSGNDLPANCVQVDSSNP